MDKYAQSMTAKQIKALVGDSPVMLEVGSHAGEHTVTFLKAMPRITLNCFEPDERPIKRFEKAIGNDFRVVLSHCMLSDVDGRHDFYRSTGKAGHMKDWDYSGSPSKPTGHLKRSPEIKFMQPVALPSRRLDSWCLAYGKTKIDFIWADLQGSQIAFINGGRKSLEHTTYLYIECHTKPLYEDEPTQDELIEMLPDFEPLAIYEKDNILFRNRNFENGV